MPRPIHYPVAERDIRSHLKRRLQVLGGEIRKLGWVARRGAPDELVLLPHHGRYFIAELKRPGGKPDRHQQREIDLMRRCGIRVEVLSTYDEVDAALFWDLI